MDLQISDPKSEFLTKTENWEFWKMWNLMFGPKNWLFEVVFETKMISKYILDHSWVILTQFPYIKTYSLMKFDENHRKSIKIDKQSANIQLKSCLGSPAGVI